MATKRTRVRSWALWLISVLMVSTVLAGCVPPAPGAGQPTASPLVTSTPSSTEIEAVLDQHRDELMRLPGVVGVGIGGCDGQSCLKVLVEERTPELESQIPEQLEGFKVDIEVTGRFDILPNS